ncbi:MAG TPA: hypothetical protein VFX70_12740 [Mycobacteriales bacterium]|nr:hypothetical protein [Mycobacteriales bacterium]
MTRIFQSPGVLYTVEATFRSLCRGPAPLALHGRRVHSDLPARPIQLTELREVLLWPHQPRSYAVREAVWAELVCRAQTQGPAWVVGAAGMALPGLRRAHARLCRRFATVDREESAAVLLAGFLTALRGADPGGDRLPGRLVWAGYGAARRYAVDQMRFQQATGPGLEEVAGSAAPPVLFGHPDLLLAHAVAGGLLTGEEADLIGATRLEQVTVAQAAGRLGVSVAAVKMRRHRAEHRLVTALRDGRLTCRGYTPTTAPGQAA